MNTRNMSKHNVNDKLFYSINRNRTLTVICNPQKQTKHIGYILTYTACEIARQETEIFTVNPGYITI